MTDHAAPTFEQPTSVGLWGPPVTQPPTPKAPRLRTRAPWGLGDVWVAFAALIGAQVLLVPLAVLGYLRREQPATIDADVLDAAIMAMPDIAKTGPFVVAALLLQWAVFVGVPVAVTFRKGLRSLAADFGLRFHRWDPLIGLGLAIALQLLMLGIGWVLARTSLDLTGANNTTLVTDHSGVMLAFMAAAAAIGAPFTEELLFRGLVLRAMLRSFAGIDQANDAHFTDRDQARRARKNRPETGASTRRAGIIAAAIGSSILFGILHMPMSDGTTHVSVAAQIILPAQTGLLGLIFAFVTIKARRLGPAICAHIVFNSTSVALALLTR